MNKRVLFVDDETLVLQGLRRSLRPMRDEWDMEFLDSAEAALAAMEQRPFDVLVTDMRMPMMDGAQLLEAVRQRFPHTARIVLSGHSSLETIMRAVTPAHQYLSKPCDIDELKQKLTRALAIQDVLLDPAMQQIVSQLPSVPSLPTLYVQITDALQKEDGTLSEVARIISQDMGMCAKMLQLVNSAFFGLPCRVSSPAQAVSLLGLDNVKALVLSIGIFSQLDPGLLCDMSSLWEHSFKTAMYAKAISTAQGADWADSKAGDSAFTAGLLHDIGKLVLACSMPGKYQLVLLKLDSRGGDASSLEQEIFGCTHGQIGAYLMGLWGLPDMIVETVGWHHIPAQLRPIAFCPLLAVHAANRFQHGRAVPDEKDPDTRKLLEDLNLLPQIPLWAKACKKLESV
jgi:HD-like signal output (HDOD) protein/CheY-like chemotaxis protein